MRRKVEDAKDIMHEELLRRYAQKMIDIEVEQERKRKLSELDKLVKGEAENQLELAQTSENLIKVQNDLKNAFKIATVSVLLLLSLGVIDKFQFLILFLSCSLQFPRKVKREKKT